MGYLELRDRDADATSTMHLPGGNGVGASEACNCEVGNGACGGEKAERRTIVAPEASHTSSEWETEIVCDAVILDMQRRKQLGLERYDGKPLLLSTDDGRDPLQEAYEETLDKAVYLRWAMGERKRLVDRITELETLNAQLCERLAACSESLGRAAERQSCHCTVCSQLAQLSK